VVSAAEDRRRGVSDNAWRYGFATRGYLGRRGDDNPRTFDDGLENG